MEIIITLTPSELTALREILEKALHLADQSPNTGHMLGVDSTSRRRVGAVIRKMEEIKTL